MPKFFTLIHSLLFTSLICLLNADSPGELPSDAALAFPIAEVAQAPSVAAQPEQSLPAVAPIVAQEAPVVAQEAPAITTPKKVIDKAPEVSVNPFTGKVKARKVRMRLKADLDSRVIKELPKNELVTIVGEKGDFWAVQAPSQMKAYVFRSFVLDNVVEGNHVNVRLEPSLDAPIIAHLNSGDKLEDPAVSAVNPKWLEISAPENTHFYIAKEFVEYAGGPEVKMKRDQRLQTAEQLLDGSALLSKTELKKSFEDIDFDRVVKGYHAVISDFAEFADLVDQAKEALATFQEEYLQKRIAYQETQSAQQVAVEESKMSTDKNEELSPIAITDKMKLWAPIEEALYLSWSNLNDNKSLRDYYEEQRLASVEITGIVEPYTTPVKSKPGDFILRENDLPIGYVYSTQVNLQNLVGTHVKLVAAPRPNNNFAFPAYFVLSVE